MSDEFGHGQRISAVETEVQTIRTEVGGLRSDIVGVKADVKGLGAILGRIEQGVAAQAQRFDDDKLASRINPFAVVTIIITVLSMMVGGSWLISGEQARQDERSSSMQRQIDRLDQRLWEGHPSGHAQAPG